jgi:hypothetical protein
VNEAVPRLPIAKTSQGRSILIRFLLYLTNTRPRLQEAPQKILCLLRQTSARAARS